MVLKKSLAIFLGIAFLSFVAVQYNDPDPLVWMLLYGVAALLCFLSAFNRAPRTVLWVGAVLYALGGVYMWPALFEGISIGSGNIKNIEEARESLGLFLYSLSFASLDLLARQQLRRQLRLQQLQKAKWAH
ncbi:transmembrane 220 family protein [Pontibacter actiniarum]|uniref:Transmembrane family 220, helix n=1 Tax=Pontibacter actiniarum TaxID=323450 RepID=A0A1X9YNP0_9BACT|nr:transmembrane 220 family protein [Pontibacter actiniarum]ARS34482.1 hypothetical protein CA264_02940 [Pontibacter actiniarum]